jgi:hypothetical protein
VATTLALSPELKPFPSQKRPPCECTFTGGALPSLVRSSMRTCLMIFA